MIVYRLIYSPGMYEDRHIGTYASLEGAKQAAADYDLKENDRQIDAKVQDLEDIGVWDQYVGYGNWFIYAGGWEDMYYIEEEEVQD